MTITAKVLADSRCVATRCRITSMPGFWHLPFISAVDRYRLKGQGALQVSAARCARTSTLKFDGASDADADRDLHDRLAEAGHWSPFEHPACALDRPRRSGNFVGWQQYRKLFTDENREHPLAPNHTAVV
jgi:hypothetical protein